MEISPRTINDMSDRNYHHSDSTKAASTFQLDNPPPIEPTLPSKQNDPKVPNFSNESDNSESSSKISMKKRERPYLILDIRDAEAFKKARIVTSKSYPAPRLSRSVNYESKDMLKYKNIQGNPSESRNYKHKTFDIIKRSELIKAFLSMRNLHMTTETTVFESYSFNLFLTRCDQYF